MDETIHQIVNACRRTPVRPEYRELAGRVVLVYPAGRGSDAYGEYCESLILIFLGGDGFQRDWLSSVAHFGNVLTAPYCNGNKYPPGAAHTCQTPIYPHLSG